MGIYGYFKVQCHAELVSAPHLISNRVQSLLLVLWVPETSSG
jgi:hypothetical protein